MNDETIHEKIGSFLTNIGSLLTNKTCVIAILAFLVLLPYSLNEWAEYQRTQLRLEAERAYLSDTDPTYGILRLLHGSH
jgi:hypothetical protein